MQNSNHVLEDIGEVIGYAEAYIDRKIQLTKLEAAEKTAEITASFATGLVLLCLVPIIFCVLSIGLGLLMSEIWEWSYSSSFFALAGGYTFLGILLFLNRENFFKEPVLAIVIQKLFKNK